MYRYHVHFIQKEAAGANPKGVFGHPLHGPFRGPVY